VTEPAFQHSEPAAAAARPPAPRPPLSQRALDLLVTVPLLVLLSPVLLVIAVAIKLNSRGPVLFRQSRIGLGDRPFLMYKFRSMVVHAPSDDRALRQAFYDELAGVAQPENDSFKLANDPRVTRVGAMLRATSLDEITQLFNVVKGEMSLVGPRPALDWEAEAFAPQYRRRTDVLPGITGLWQVSGRSHLSTPEMLDLDLEYVDRRSLWLDIQILFRTIPTVIRGDGAR
jgi:lipopolysaccharide/colanic/teichoic acid biosynthesis glycosyltransferase